MAQHFTWQQFLIAAMVFTIIWYAGVILIFYRNELKAFFKGKLITGRKKEPLPHRWEKGVEKMENPEQETLLGKTKMPEGISIVGIADFGFTGPSSTSDQVGLVPDLLEDIKKVFQLLVKEDGNKKDFFNLMVGICKDYPQMGSHPSIGHINGFIAEHAPFHLSKEELENLWY